MRTSVILLYSFDNIQICQIMLLLCSDDNYRLFEHSDLLHSVKYTI